MLYTSVALFALAAVAGFIVIRAVWQKKETPKAAVFAHGTLAALGLVLLVVYALQNPQNFPQLSLILFVAAALGGFYLFARDMRKSVVPVSVAAIHALIAVSGFVVLLLFVFG